MSEENPIIAKIRALLRLAKSDNAHEAALAMERALEIANKHRIDLSSVSEEDDLRKLLHRHLDTPSRLALEFKEALNIANGFFNVDVTVLTGRSKCLVVGTALDIELAEYVVTFLVRACRACLAAWKAQERAERRKTTGAKVHCFIRGFFYGIRNKLREQRQSVQAAHNGYALTLADEAEARRKMAEGVLGGKITTLTMPQARMDRRAQFQGFLQGDKTQLNPGLRGNSSTLALC